MEKDKAFLKSHGIAYQLQVQILKLPTTIAPNILTDILISELQQNYKIRSGSPQQVEKDENKSADGWREEINCKKSDNELLLLNGITSQVGIHIVKQDVAQLINTFHSKPTSKLKIRKRVHKIKRLYKCPICPSHVELSTFFLTKHLETSHKSKNVLKCSFPTCEFSTRVSYFLNNHLARVHHQLPFQCSVCPKKCKTQAHLKVHMLIHSAPESKKYICPRPNCEYACHYAISLKRHLQSHDLEFKYKCPHCSWKTKYEKSIAVHIEKAHENSIKPKPFKCPQDQCNFTADKLRKITLHSQVHSDHKPLKCHLCEFSTKYRNRFRAHLVVHSGLKKFECHLCRKKIRTSQNLQDHLRRHLGEKLFKCQQSPCDYMAATRSEIKVHVDLHHSNYSEKKIETFMCPLCIKGFRTKRALATHAHTHTLEKPFSCSFCSREFGTNPSKNSHEKCCKERPGGQIKPCKCEYCEMRFCRMGTKSLHEMTCKLRPDGKIIQPFKCSVDGCSFAATQKCNLKFHCNRFHQ